MSKKNKCVGLDCEMCGNTKCPNEEKETIINGIDVSECLHLDEWKHCDICEELIKTIPDRHQCIIEKDLRCECYSDCYFKQLKRLQKENEELKKKKDEYYLINLDYEAKISYLIQALEEIKKWATNHNPCDIEAGINCTKEDCFECLNYDIKKITKIIDEALNDK